MAVRYSRPITSQVITHEILAQKTMCGVIGLVQLRRGGNEVPCVEEPAVWEELAAP